MENDGTVYSKLLLEISAAIQDVLGDNAELPAEDYEITASDIDEIAHKTKFYLDL